MCNKTENNRLFITRHARLRLQERFPGQELEVIRRCNRFYRDLSEFAGSSLFRYRSDNLIAVIAHRRLVTVFPPKRPVN